MVEENCLPDLLASLLSAPDPATQAAVIDGWPLAAIDEVQLSAVRAKAAEVLRVDLQLSLRLGELILRAAARTGDPLHRAIGLIVVANAYSLGGVGRAAEAVPLYDEAARAFRAASRPADEAGTQIAKVLALMELGRHDEAFATGQWATEVLAANGDWLRLGKLTANLGNLKHRRGETADALAMYDKAREYYLRLPDNRAARQALGRAEHNRSVLLRDLGRFDEAIRTANNALDILRETGQIAETARCNQNLAITFAILGRYNDALVLLSESRAFFTRDGRSRDAVEVSLYIAQCLLRLRRFEPALRLSQEAKDQFERLGEEFFTAEAQFNEAVAYSGLGRYDEALSALAATRRRFEVAGSLAWAALTDLDRAGILRRLGRYHEALELAQRCSAAFASASLPVERAQADLAAAEAALALGRDAEAELLLAAAEQTGQASDLPTLLLPCHELRAKLVERAGDLAGALRHLEAAMNELERLRSGLMIEHRVDFIEDKAAIYEDGMALALELNWPARALGYAERTRSRSLIEMLDFRMQAGLRATTAADVPLVDELVRLRNERDEIYRRWVAEREFGARSKAAPGEELRQVQAQVLGIERQMTDLWRQLLVRGAGYTGQASLWRLGPKAPFQDLPAGSVLLEYAVARGALLAFVATGDEVRCVRLPMKLAEAERLLALLQFNLRTVAARGLNVASALLPNARGLLASLYDGLIAPVAELLGLRLFDAEQLIVVPHGPLHYLPFHALYDGERYLGSHVSLSYLTSGDLLSRLASRERAEGQAVSLGFSTDGQLRHAVAEAEEAAEILGGRAFVNDAAVSEVLRTEARFAPVVHLATHAEFRADNPLFSGLRLADTWLTTLDIFGLELNASLVTLSGCHTGRSVVGGGQELLGLARAFLAAGAASVLLSLWAVDDETSAHYMRHFYKALIRGESKVAALRYAGRSIRADGPYEHPYYWAPFVLMGDTGCL